MTATLRGALNRAIRIGYLVRTSMLGDAYPFRWFNAGDFGNTNLENADVIVSR